MDFQESSSTPQFKSINSLALSFLYSLTLRASLIAQLVKNLPAMQETLVQFLAQEDFLEKGINTHSSILAWRITRTEELDRLQSMGSQPCFF